MEKLNFSQLQKNEKPCRHVLIYKYRKLIWIQISFWGFNLMVWRKISAVRYAVSVFSLTNPETNDVYRFSFNRFPLSLPSADGEPSLPEYSSEREGDADLLYLHGEEQQEPLGPERGWWQTPGLNFPHNNHSGSYNHNNNNCSYRQNLDFSNGSSAPSCSPLRTGHELLLSLKDSKQKSRVRWVHFGFLALFTEIQSLPFDLALSKVFPDLRKPGP